MQEKYSSQVVFFFIFYITILKEGLQNRKKFYDKPEN